MAARVVTSRWVRCGSEGERERRKKRGVEKHLERLNTVAWVRTLFLCMCMCLQNCRLVCVCVCGTDRVLDQFQVLPGNPLWIGSGSALFLLRMESIINGHLEDFIGIQ